MSAMKSMPSMKISYRFFLTLLVLLLLAPYSYAAAPAGYSEYYVPGDENLLSVIWGNIGSTGGVPTTGATAARHTIINVVAWSPTTTVYYDHWENGYNFDPSNPAATADEVVVLTNKGDSHTFENTAIPVNPRGTDTYYDGGDHIYVAGGEVSVTRESWTDTTGTVMSIAWDVYPVKPQMTTYILPFGEDLYALNNTIYRSFDRVFALVQATEDNTTVKFDVNGDGTFDNVCTDITRSSCTPGTVVTLNKGQTFLLDDYALSPQTAPYNATRTGTVIQGSATLQVNYVVGNHSDRYQARGFSAFPSSYWGTEYYSPVDSSAGTGSYQTDIYLYNPNSSTLTINYQTNSGSGSLAVPANSTRSFQSLTGTYVPQGSGVYLTASDVFWGVTNIDDGGPTYEWGYVLIPTSMLSREEFLGWAPSSYPITAGNYDDAGIFVTPLQDNTTVFVDLNHDGVPDQTYKLNRLQTQYIYNATTGDMSNSDIWATGTLALAYGQNTAYAPTGAPAIDLGYAVIPGGQFVDKVLTVAESTNPIVVPTASGSTSTYTIVVNSYFFTANGINVTDTLPSGWQYVNNSTTITLADMTTLSSSSANPITAGQVLTWPNSILGNMAPNQTITITFTAQTTQNFNVGDLTRNVAQASGTRTVGSPPVTQTFVASDFVFNSYGNMTVTKSSSATDPLYPGNQFTYSVTVANPSAAAFTGVSVNDPLPAGLSYVGPMQISRSTVGDNFSTVAYNNQDGTRNWSSNWLETIDTTNPSTGFIQIVNGELRLTNSSSNEPTIYRSANLTGATSATLSFNYRTSSNVDSNDTIYIQAATSSGGTYTTIGTFTGISGASNGSFSASLNSYISATTSIRFRFANNNYNGSNEYFYVDNLFITYNVSVSNTTILPPGLINGYALLAGETLTMTYNVTVNNPLAAGINQITNTAFANCNEIPLPVKASVTNLVVNPSSLSAAVEGRVWLDANGNGAQDLGEPGLGSVEVALKNWLGATVMTITTDTTGHYLFTGVKPGNGYYIELTPRTIPPGLQQSAPAGHTDNRTNAFDLAAGSFYTDANLGYKAPSGSATVMSIVWNDANSNGARDAGEPGLAGVTVQLWRDTNSNGLYEPGTDTLWGSTTTAADGSYIFTGIPAGNPIGTEDYFVYVDGSQAKLTGYTRTAPSTDPLYINNLSAGDVIQYANFGYHAATAYFIKDRIWFDANSNGSLDAGETGIALVRVDLLDASLNAIATTTTDADGYFTFPGLIGGGADYTVRITDTNGKLTNYFGTTAAAKTGTKQIINLTGNVDYSSSPSFGYGLKNSVVGSVFNDLSNNGNMDSGEPGFTGVTVKLYNDANGNGRIDAGNDTVRATLTTDPYGKYIFSGLSNGNYIVSVESPPSGYTYTGTDSDPVTTGQQQAASIAANGNALNKNFGYYSSAARSVTGTLWNDTNNNGVKDTGEPGIAGVTISLLQGSNVVATTSTATNGSYSFTGLTPGSYVVRITDDTGVLSGYIGTYEKTEDTAGPFNGQEDVNLSSSSLTGIDFGYVSPAIPTLAILSSFSAHEQDGEVVLQWETASEHNTLGFYLLRLDTATGGYRSITQGLLPGLLNNPRGGTYSLVDKGASPDSVYRYKLVEVERNGRQIAYGPFTVSVTTGHKDAVNIQKDGSAGLTAKVNSASPSTYTRMARQQSTLQKAFTEDHMAVSVSAMTTMKSKSALITGSRIKIPVREDGLYYVDAEDIAAATGISYTKAIKLIGKNSLAVSNQDQPVAYLPAANNAGIYFYGTGTDSAYTRDNIYWIDKAKGITMQDDDKTLLPVSTNPGAAFTDTMHIEQNLIQNMVQTSNPAEDFWDWDLIYLSSSYSDGPKTFTFSLNGKSETQSEATLQIHLFGGSDSGIEQDHHVVVSLNGRQIVESWWGGLNEHVVMATFDQSILNEGENSVEVRGILDEGIPWSMFYINSFDLTYERLYKAVGNKLFFTGDGNQIVTVSGFTTATPDIYLLNITDPRRPKFNTSASINGSMGDYEISYNVASQSARYLAVSGDAAVKVVNTAGVKPSKLRSKRNSADYLIIAPGELVSAAQPLAAYRKVQKMKTMVVNLDDIMNEFNFGMSSPEAIRQFLTYAYHNWKKAPKYVVLAGTGTWDYRDNLGAGGNLIPPALMPTAYGLSTSDNHLADIDGDHIPDMAIGRLPVGNSQELQDVIGKIKTYERNAGNKIILLADRPDEGGNFSSDSEAIAGFFPSGYTLEKVYLGEYASADTAKQVLLNYINSGAVFFNFIGHASPDMFSAEGILTTDDMGSLINGSGLPIITAMTCTAGEFAIPGYPSMSQLMVLKSSGGAAAFWSSTGLSDNSESAILNRDFYNAVCSGKKLTLGDAVLEAFMKYRTSGSMPFMTDIYNILGDPALRLK
jgi:uncharacterized repeat protein (TIGR01451 family)